jgi:hypothetical protein
MQPITVSKYEIFYELETRGYIKKPTDPATASATFHCDAKHCKKLLEAEFELTGSEKNGYPVPSNIRMLREAMNRSATRRADGTIDPVPDVKRRCFICIYRAYRNVYRRKYGTFPDADVPDNFTNVIPRIKAASPIDPVSPVKPKSPMKPKSTSPMKPKSPTKPNVDEIMRVVLKDVHPLWSECLDQFVSLRERYQFISAAKTDYFVLVVPSDKAATHLVNKTRYNKKVMIPSLASDDNFALFHLLSCAVGSIGVSNYDEKAKSYFLATSTHPTKPGYIAEWKNGKWYVDGISVTEVIETHKEQHGIIILKINGILSTPEINEGIDEL